MVYYNLKEAWIFYFYLSSRALKNGLKINSETFQTQKFFPREGTSLDKALPLSTFDAFKEFHKKFEIIIE